MSTIFSTILAGRMAGAGIGHLRQCRLFLATLAGLLSMPAALVANTPPLTLWVTAENTSPGQTTTIAGSASDVDGDLQLLLFFVNPPNLTGWEVVTMVPVPAGPTIATEQVTWPAPEDAKTGGWLAHVRAIDSADQWDSNSHVMTTFAVKQRQQVWSQDATVYAGDAFSPAYGGGGGTGAWQFVVSYYTNWGGTEPGTLLYPGNIPSATWTPSQAGTYVFWVHKLGDENYYESANSGPYTLTVLKRPQPAVSSQNVTLSQGQAFTPPYAGGDGTGAWQFVVANHTNWGGSEPGTLLYPGNIPSTTWMPPAAGNYTFWVRRMGDAMYEDTAPAGPYTLTVTSGTPPPPTAPSIVTSPSSQTVTVGASVGFSVVATGSAPLGYQWRKNGAPIAGATGTSYAIASAQLGDAGSYDVVVSNSAGTAQSAAAILTVQAGSSQSPPTTAPSIVTSPSSQTVTVGASVGFSVGATGSAPLGYQWRKDGSPIAGATGASYAIASAQLEDAGSYDVVVSNSAGTAQSAPATLTVKKEVVAAPVLLVQPRSQRVTEGEAVSFAVSVSGAAPFTYEWSKNGVVIAGAVEATYSIAKVRMEPGGGAPVRVSNAGGAVVSDVATLTVESGVPAITGVATAAGAVGEAFPGYAIQASNRPASYGATGLPGGLTLDAVTGVISGQPYFAGKYEVMLTATNAYGTSPAFMLTITIAVSASGDDGTPQLRIHRPR